MASNNLLGAFSFFDAQTDDYALGNWVVEQYKHLGGKLIAQHNVSTLAELDGFDRIINATGPWVMDLRQQQDAQPIYSIDCVRGSHIVINRPMAKALFLQVPHEKRIFFVLPYQNKTLIGTTEKRQTHPETDGVSEDEVNYLISAYNHYLMPQINREHIHQSFSGVRPLIYSTSDPGRASREWAFERIGKVLHIYGGKWTTAQIQGKAACKEILK